jgi:hypothetical protein
MTEPRPMDTGDRGDQKMTDVRRGLPVDDRQSGAEAGDGGDYEEATASAAALRDRILADPAGKAAYERATRRSGTTRRAWRRSASYGLLLRRLSLRRWAWTKARSPASSGEPICCSPRCAASSTPQGGAPPRRYLPRRRRRAVGRLDPVRRARCPAPAGRLGRATFVPQRLAKPGRGRAQVVKSKGRLTCPNVRTPWCPEGATAPSQAENAGSIPVARSLRKSW